MASESKLVSLLLGFSVVDQESPRTAALAYPPPAKHSPGCCLYSAGTTPSVSATREGEERRQRPGAAGPGRSPVRAARVLSSPSRTATPPAFLRYRSTSSLVFVLLYINFQHLADF